MNKIFRCLYATDVVCAFMFGVVTPSLIPTEVSETYREIGVLLGNRALVLLIAVILAAGASAAAMYVMVCTARHQPMIVLLLVKLFAIALPAVATGYLASIALWWLGVYEAAAPAFAFLLVGAVLYFCGGIAGIAAMNATPEYNELLRH